MPTSHKRKSVSLPKQYKIVRKRRTTATQRKQAKKITPYVVLLDSGKYVKRAGVKTQAFYRQLEYKRIKREHLPKAKVSRSTKKLYNYVKRYKSAVAKKYRKELVEAMKGRYFPFEIRWAKRYSIVGMRVHTAIDMTTLKFYRKGKFISKEKQNSMIKRAVKKARIESYMDILGITKEKAKEILNIFEKHLPGEFELKALIY